MVVFPLLYPEVFDRFKIQPPRYMQFRFNTMGGIISNMYTNGRSLYVCVEVCHFLPLTGNPHSTFPSTLDGLPSHKQMGWGRQLYSCSQDGFSENDFHGWRLYPQIWLFMNL